MKVLILGANGMLGPHVVKALEGRHELRLTDINDLDSPHEYFKVDAGDIDQVVSAAEGMDAIINLSVLRTDRQLAFDVSARGCYNMMAAAVEHGIDRVINSGPFYAATGPTYERFDHLIGPDVPHQPGTFLYALTKSLGQEICRVFTEFHDIHVMDLLFYMFLDPEAHNRVGFADSKLGPRPGPVRGLVEGRGGVLQVRAGSRLRPASFQVRGFLRIPRSSAPEIHG